MIQSKVPKYKPPSIPKIDFSFFENVAKNAETASQMDEPVVLSEPVPEKRRLPPSVLVHTKNGDVL
jgi:hypothetical protein